MNETDRVEDFNQFSNNLLSWFDVCGRHDLPWQQDLSDYRVWISEIMLQQTQVVTVIPYYQRFMESFPSVYELARAHEDLVLSHWSGLGYYSRARNLHQAAKLIVANYAGCLPTHLNELMQLPGIGRTTAGAILSIVHNQHTPILDGNVKRVLCRVFLIAGWPESTPIKKRLWDIATRCMPSTRSGDYSQAIMDLGAMVCTRTKPNCPSCPLSTLCSAHSSNTSQDFPHKKPKKAKPIKEIQFLLLSNQKGQIYLEKRAAKGLWGGLWTLPSRDHTINLTEQLTHLHSAAQAPAETLLRFRHTFSHFHLDIEVLSLRVKHTEHSLLSCESKDWFYQNQLHTRGLAKPISKTLKHYFESARVMSINKTMHPVIKKASHQYNACKDTP